MSNPRQRDTALHEMQHEIQNKEGFARGGNPDEFKEVYKEQRKHVDLLASAGAVRTRMDLLNEPLDRAAKEVADAAGQDAETLLKLVEAYPGEEIHEAFKRAYAVARKWEPTRAYRSLAGEAEARLVESRRSLTAEERRMLYPWLGYDVPPEQQIVRGVR